MKKIFLSIFFASLLFLSPFSADTVSAADPLIGSDGSTACDCSSVTCSGSSKQTDECGKYCCGDYELNDFINMAVKFSNLLLGVTGSLALLFFVYGGIMFLISGGNKEKVEKAKQILIGAVIGIILIFTSYTIIKFSTESLGINATNVGQDWNTTPQ